MHGKQFQIIQSLILATDLSFKIEIIRIHR
jgi:hypothetical protein